MEKVKDRLYQAMAIRGIKPTELANKVGINKSSISNYLAGRYEPNAEKIHRFAVALNVSEGWLLGYDDVPMDRDPEEVNQKKSQTIEDEMSDRFLEHICKIFKESDFEGQLRIYEAVRKIDIERKEKKETK